MSVRIFIGDALTELRNLPDESVHCCVTSPPYFNLRDYGCAGQIGLEPSPDGYVAALVAVFREVRRVLRNDGTLWLNIGDSYSAGSNTRGGLAAAAEKADGKPRNKENRSDENGAHLFPTSKKIPLGLKAKDLCGIPWRIALALQEDGWWLRSDIIWSKPNPMPESITDRPTKSHEYLFLLAKSDRYYYNAEAIAEPSLRAGDIPRGGRPATNAAEPRAAFIRPENSAKPVADTRNKRSVWTVATSPYSDAHFATFPPALIEPCILAGCPEGGVVLDPFSGAGTTGLVADRLGRNAVLIELNPAYAEMARKRISDDAGGLFGAAAIIATATVSDNLGLGSNTDSHPESGRWDCPELVR